MANPKIKAIFFDFMGTCLDWHSGATSALPNTIPQETRSKLALEWRHDYFDYNAARLASGKGPEDIDISMANTLSNLLAKPEHAQWASHFDDATRQRCVDVWHSMPAWPDVNPAIEELKALGYEVFVFANGTTRLQLDLCRSSGLKFHMLFSSQLLGHIKPAPESYTRTLELVKVRPEETVMVAAHAYDTRGGKVAGMRTVYIHRWTDDVNEDMEVVKGEHDFFLEDMKGLVDVIGRF